MGRPIKDKYFGSSNAPYQNQASGGPTGAGGEGVASIAVGGTNNNYTAIPAIVIDPPALPTGVQAVASARMEVDSIINFTAGAGYTPGQVLTLTGGTGTQATFTVGTTRVVNLVVGSNAGTGYTTGDVVTIQGGTGTLATATVIAAGGNVTGFSTFTPGSYTVNPGTLTDAATVKSGGTGDDLLTVTFQMGINTATVTTGGEYSALPADITIVPHAGPGGALFNLDYKVKSVVVTTAGSGYIAAPTVVDNPNGNATFLATLGTSTANAIAVTAWTTSGGSALDGDIMKQSSSRRYLVKTADGVGICKLVTAAPAAAGEMTMTAVDSAGGTYYVKKLTARRALIVKGDRSGTQFTTGANGISVPWVFAPNSAVLNTSVEILSV